MNGYFSIIIFLWIIIGLLIKYFDIEIYKKGKLFFYISGLFIIFVIPGFFVDWIAVSFEWYVFPQSTEYLWRTPLNIPIEEALFFMTVPVLIITLWKVSKKLFP